MTKGKFAVCYQNTIINMFQQLYNYFSEYTWMAAAKKRQEFKSEWYDV